MAPRGVSGRGDEARSLILILPQSVHWDGHPIGVKGRAPRVNQGVRKGRGVGRWRGAAVVADTQQDGYQFCGVSPLVAGKALQRVRSVFLLPGRGGVLLGRWAITTTLRAVECPEPDRGVHLGRPAPLDRVVFSRRSGSPQFWPVKIIRMTIRRWAAAARHCFRRSPDGIRASRTHRSPRPLRACCHHQRRPHQLPGP